MPIYFALPTCLLAVALGLSGCVNLKPKPDLTTRYVLGPVGVAAESASTIEGLESIYVMRPELPTYLATNRLVYREPGGALVEIKDALWAEPFDQTVARALAEYFGSVSATGYGFYPWQSSRKNPVKVSVHFQRMDANADGSILVAATWMVTENGVKIAEGRYTSANLTWTVGEPNSYVSALNAALKTLASDVSGQL
ncbi:MAG: ABC-type transport auxiliary lipoprotein family protein [Verrucomicrobiota bacterium]